MMEGYNMDNLTTGNTKPKEDWSLNKMDKKISEKFIPIAKANPMLVHYGLKKQYPGKKFIGIKAEIWESKDGSRYEKLFGVTN